MEQYTCANCELRASGEFCQHCGQKKFERGQFDLWTAVKDVFSEIFDLESTLGKTFRYLIASPGKLTIDHLSGKQKSYVTPVKLYLIVITINFLVYSWLERYSLINIEFLKQLTTNISFLQNLLATAMKNSRLQSDLFYHTVNTRINEVLPFLLYFLIFLQALTTEITVPQIAVVLHGTSYLQLALYGVRIHP